MKQLIQFRNVTDERGTLCFGEFPRDLPFEPKRVFYFYDCPTGAIRGEHAHKASRQVHICMEGAVTFTLDDGTHTEEVVLDEPNTGLIIEPMIWHSLRMGENARLFVLSSDIYDESDYIRKYDEFLTLVKQTENKM